MQLTFYRRQAVQKRQEELGLQNNADDTRRLALSMITQPEASAVPTRFHQSPASIIWDTSCGGGCRIDVMWDLHLDVMWDLHLDSYTYMACCRAPSIRVPRGGWVGPSESPRFRYDDDDDDDGGDGWVVNASRDPS